MRERVLLFDPVAGGHHEMLLAQAVATLAPHAKIVVAAPEQARARLGPGTFEFHPLGTAETLRQAVAATGATRAVHLYADDDVEELERTSPVGVPVSLVIMRASSHYPRHFASIGPPRDVLAATRRDRTLRRWRRRPGAGPVLFFDEVAARLAARRRGSPAVWMPQPPVTPTVAGNPERRGVVLAGALAPRKGIARLAAAVSIAPTSLKVTLAGQPEPGYGEELRDQVATMRASGADVCLLDRWLTDPEYLTIIAGAQVGAAPYLRHRGTARFVLDAAAVGTPVIADRWGHPGWQVREHGLGRSVDTSNPHRFREALDELTATPPDEGLQARLRHFAEGYTPERFAQAMLRVLD